MIAFRNYLKCNIYTIFNIIFFFIKFSRDLFPKIIIFCFLSVILLEFFNFISYLTSSDIISKSYPSFIILSKHSKIVIPLYFPNIFHLIPEISLSFKSNSHLVYFLNSSTILIVSLFVICW